MAYSYVKRATERAEKTPGESYVAKGKAPAPGEGGRFKALKGALGKKKGVRTPGALASWIGRRKWGKKKMAQWSAKGRKK